MRSSEDCIPTSSRNVFTHAFLQRLGERDEPPTAGEADVAGPWHMEEIPGHGFGLFRSGESLARGFRPYAVFRRRSLALLAAAVLPLTGRDASLRLAKERDDEGFAIEATHPAGEVTGHCELFDESLVDGLNLLEGLARSPESFANLLEASGALLLERAGTILDERVQGEEPQKDV
jgi:hypothetical protein